MVTGMVEKKGERCPDCEECMRRSTLLSRPSADPGPSTCLTPPSLLSDLKGEKEAWLPGVVAVLDDTGAPHVPEEADRGSPWGTGGGVGVSAKMRPTTKGIPNGPEVTPGVACRVSARVEVQLGDDPRYLARMSRHIKADCAMPSLSCSVSPFSSASSAEETGARQPLTAARRWDVRSRKSARCVGFSDEKKKKDDET